MRVPPLMLWAAPPAPDALPFERMPWGTGSSFPELRAPAPRQSGTANLKREPHAPIPGRLIDAAVIAAFRPPAVTGKFPRAVSAGPPAAPRIPARYAAGTPGVLRPSESPPASYGARQALAHLPDGIIRVSNLSPAPISGPVELDLRWRPSRRRWLRGGCWRAPVARFIFAAPLLALAPAEFDDAWQDWRDPSRTDALLASVRRAARNVKTTESEP
jgi:hypothetical protein